MEIQTSDVRVKLANFYSWKNYHAGWEFNVSNKTKTATVKTCTTDSLWVVATKINKALKE